MAQRIIDWYNTSPYRLERGDVAAITITAHITEKDEENGILYVRCYRCPFQEEDWWPEDLFGKTIPQGAPVGAEESVALFKAMFPAFAAAYEIKYR